MTTAYRPRPWTEAEEQTVRTLHRPGEAARSYREIAVQLGRSWQSVASRARVLGLARSRGTRSKRWTEVADTRLTSLYGNVPRAEIARRMKRSIASISNRAQTLGLDGYSHTSVYTPAEIAQMLGATKHWVHDRIHSGAIRATLTGNAYRVRRKDLREFVRRYPGELQGRNVQMVELVELLAGVLAKGE